MLISFVKKKVVESLIKEAISKLPELKEYALAYLDEHKDEIFEEIKEKIVEIVKSKIGR